MRLSNKTNQGWLVNSTLEVHVKFEVIVDSVLQTI